MKNLNEKVCSKCKQLKPINEFYPSQIHASWARCIPCFRSYYDYNDGKEKRKQWHGQWYSKPRNRRKTINRSRIWRQKNPDRYRQATKDYAAKTKSKHKDCHLRRLYGITLAEYNAMLIRQNNRCAGCNYATNDLRVDHDHNTGLIRGLLCNDCNLTVGKYFDSIGSLLALVCYLFRTSSIESYLDMNPWISQENQAVLNIIQQQKEEGNSILFEVALIKKPTKKQAEDGAIEELIMAPTAVIAKDDKGAAIKAVVTNKDKIDVDLAQVEVLVRPFAQRISWLRLILKL